MRNRQGFLTISNPATTNFERYIGKLLPYLLIPFHAMHCLIYARIYVSTEAATRGVLKKGVLRNFTKFTGKHLCHSLFFNKISGLPATF